MKDNDRRQSITWGIRPKRENASSPSPSPSPSSSSSSSSSPSIPPYPPLLLPLPLPKFSTHPLPKSFTPPIPHSHFLQLPPYLSFASRTLSTSASFAIMSSSAVSRDSRMAFALYECV